MKTHKEHRTQRRIYPKAVQMLLDGHSASSVAHKILWEHKRRYEARRIAAELAAQGETCGPSTSGQPSFG